MNELRILIVEDEPLIAENIAAYLNNADFKVSGIAYDEEEVKRQLQYNTPDAVLLDINLDCGTDGIELAAYINKNYQLPFLFLTSYADKETLERAKQTEPFGYIVKPFHEQSLLASLEIAISNYAKKANQCFPFLSMEKINKHLLSQLSEKEFKVLQLIYSGYTNNQIAEIAFISINTVKAHIKNAYVKLDASSRTNAIVKLREMMMK